MPICDASDNVLFPDETSMKTCFNSGAISLSNSRCRGNLGINTASGAQCTKVCHAVLGNAILMVRINATKGDGLLAVGDFLKKSHRLEDTIISMVVLNILSNVHWQK